MPRRPGYVRALNLIALNIAVVAVPTLIYFFVYVDANETYFTRRAFRTLDETAERTSGLLEHFGFLFRFSLVEKSIEKDLGNREDLGLEAEKHAKQKQADLRRLETELESLKGGRGAEADRTQKEIARLEAELERRLEEQRRASEKHEISEIAFQGTAVDLSNLTDARDGREQIASQLSTELEHLTAMAPIKPERARELEIQAQRAQAHLGELERLEAYAFAEERGDLADMIRDERRRVASLWEEARQAREEVQGWEKRRLDLTQAKQIVEEELERLAARVAGAGAEKERARQKRKAAEEAALAVAEQADETRAALRAALDQRRQEEQEISEKEQTLLEAEKAFDEASGEVERRRKDLKRTKDYRRRLRASRAYRAVEIWTDGAPAGSCNPESTVPSLHVRHEVTPTLLRVTGCRLKREEEGAEENAESTEKGEQIFARVPLRDLVDLRTIESSFDQFLIADEHGRVLFTSPGALHRVDNVAALLRDRSEDGNVDAERDSGATPNERDTRAETLLPRHSRRLERTIGGEGFYVFVQPYRVPLPRAAPPGRSRGNETNESNQKAALGQPSNPEAESDGAPPGSEPPDGQVDESSAPEGAVAGAPVHTWYLCGLVSESRFRASVFAPSLPLLASVALLLVLGVLSWPWIKLWTIDRREELRAGDAYFLAGSLWLGTGLVTLLALQLVTFREVRSQTDQTARFIAERARGELRVELLETLDSARAAREEIHLGVVDTVGGCETARQDKGAILRSFTYRDGAPELPPFEIAYLADARGRQLGRQVTYRSAGAADAPVATRRYFQRVRDRRTWTLTGDDAPSARLFLQRVHSYDHGLTLTALSMPAASKACEATMFAVLRRMASLWRPVLPPGFSLALIEDASGLVLYHSDDDRSLVENLFAETDSDASLRHAVRARRGEALSGSYYGTRHRFLVEPIRDLPWSLVVLYDQSLFDTLSFEISLAVVGHLLIFVVVLLLGAAVVAQLAEGTPWAWMWPQARHERRYDWALLWLLPLGLLLAVGIWNVEGVELLQLAIGIPLVTFSGLFLAFEPVIATRLRRRQVAWMLAAAGAVLAMAVAFGGGTWATALAALAVAVAAIWGWRFAPARTSMSLLTGAVATLALAAVAGWLRGGLGVLLVACFGVAVGLTRPLLGQTEVQSPSGRFGAIYLLAALLSLLIVAVMPTAAIFKDAFRVHFDKLVKHGQLEMMMAVDEREDAVRAYASQLNPEVREAVIPAGADCRGIYAVPDVLVRDLERERKADCWSREDGVVPVPGAAPGGAPPTDFTHWLAKRLTGFNEHSHALRHALHDGATDGSWKWRDCRGVGSCTSRTAASPAGDPPPGRRFLAYTMSFDDSRYRLQPDEAGPRAAPRYRLESAMIEPHVVPTRRLDQLALAFGTAACLLVAWLLLRSLGRRVFGLDLPDPTRLPEPSSPKEWGTRSWMLLRPSREYVDDLLVRLREESGEDQVGEIKLATPKGPAPARLPDYERDGWPLVVVVRGFDECLSDVLWRKRLLEFLEELVIRRRRKVLLCCDRAPLFRVARPDAYPETEDWIGAVDADEGLRWSALLCDFEKVYCTPQGGSEPDAWHREKRTRRAVLLRECGVFDQLDPVRKRILEDPAFPTLTADQIVEQVRDQAEAFYRRMWALCTRDERLALVHLARGSFANPTNADVVGSLMRRDLIRRTPAIDIANQSLAAFASSAEAPEHVATWERAAGHSRWSVLRVPLFVVLALVSAFVAYAGRDAFDSVVGILPALAAGVPVLLRLLGAALFEGKISFGKLSD